MTHQIYRKVGEHWVLIVTSIGTLELARSLRDSMRSENPKFAYKICSVSIVDVEVDA